MGSETAEFLYDKTWCSISLAGEAIHLKRIKTLTSTNSVSASSFSKEIDIESVISTSFATGEWQVNGEDEQAKFSNCMQRNVAECFVLSIKYWVKEKKRKRKLQAIHLRTHDGENAEKWSKLIQSNLQETLRKHKITRPRNLLVFVNPFGGKRKATEIYKKRVSPLFETAGISSTVIYTKYGGHAKEYIQSEDISSYDGIIAVGGDGTYSEVVNGVLIKEQRNKGIPLNGQGPIYQQSPCYAASKMKIGMIAGGSTNAINWTAYGTEDAETAALQIICGETHPFNVCSVHDNEGQFAQFSAMISTFGFLAQIMKTGESMRMFGPIRYRVAIVPVMFKHISYPCEISYLETSPSGPVNLSKETTQCRYPCSTCLDDPDNSLTPLQEKRKEPASSQKSKVTSEEASIGASSSVTASLPAFVSKSKIDTKDETLLSGKDNVSWKIIRERFLWMSSQCNALVYDKAPMGWSPSAHLNDGAVDIILIRPTSRYQLLRFILSLGGRASNFDHPSVEVIRVRGFRIRPLSENDIPVSNSQASTKTSQPIPTQSFEDDQNTAPLLDTSAGVWTVDGEFLNSPSFTAWAHKSLISFFTKGIEDEY